MQSTKLDWDRNLQFKYNRKLVCITDITIAKFHVGWKFRDVFYDQNVNTFFSEKPIDLIVFSILSWENSLNFDPNYVLVLIIKTSLIFPSDIKVWLSSNDSSQIWEHYHPCKEIVIKSWKYSCQSLLLLSSYFSKENQKFKNH